MENKDLNLLGTQVNSMKEAMKILNCSKEDLIYNVTATLCNGITFTIHTYTAENNSNFCWGVNACNLESNQYD